MANLAYMATPRYGLPLLESSKISVNKSIQLSTSLRECNAKRTLIASFVSAYSCQSNTILWASAQHSLVVFLGFHMNDVS